MSNVAEATAAYRSEFTSFAREVSGAEPAWVGRLREAAMARFAELGFPSVLDEGWRQSDVALLASIPFRAAPDVSDTRGIEQCAALDLDSFPGPRLVFLNGRFLRELSALPTPPSGATLCSLAAALAGDPSGVEPDLARYARYEDHPFVALNTAFMRDGAFLHLPERMVVEEPIHVLFVSTAEREAVVTHPRTLIVAGPHSRATIVETYVGWREHRYFTNAVTELVLGEHAVIDHYALDRESSAACHLATLAVEQRACSRFSSTSLTLGAALLRKELRALLAAEGGACTLGGLYLAGGRQHLELRTTIDHATPQGISRQMYKGILDGQARAAFLGKVLVRQDAQKTDAAQSNHNLLLSEDAAVHTAPQFEILADDVKCRHGATVGRLDRDALFYLRSRGLGREAARRFLVRGFANEVVDRITAEPIRTHFARLASQWIARGEPHADAPADEPGRGPTDQAAGHA